MRLFAIESFRGERGNINSVDGDVPLGEFSEWDEVHHTNMVNIISSGFFVPNKFDNRDPFFLQNNICVSMHEKLAPNISAGR